MHIGFIGLLVLAYLSAPAPFFPDYFAQRNILARFPFAMISVRVLYINEKPVSNVTLPLGQGMVSFFGNGSISAGNPLTVDVIVFLNATVWGRQPKTVAIQLDSAFFNPATLDSHGIALNAALGLTRQGDVWGGLFKGAHQVEYDQGGSFPIRVSIDDTLVQVIGQIQMGSRDVTIGIRTNSLILSLTWAILAFAVLELRVDNYPHERKKCNTNDNRV